MRLVHAKTCILLLFALELAACGTDEPMPGDAAETAMAPSNRIDLPKEAIESLGITFGTAKRGRLETYLDVPGRLVVPPDRRRVVRAPSAGRLHYVERADGMARADAPWSPATQGATFAEIRSAELGDIQEHLGKLEGERQALAIEQASLARETEAQRRLAKAAHELLEATRGRLRRASAHERQTAAMATLADTRAQELERLAGESAIGKKDLVDARQDALSAAALAMEALNAIETTGADLTRLAAEAALADARAQRTEQEAELATWRHAAATRHMEAALARLAHTVGESVASLGNLEGDTPRWAELESLPLFMPIEGVVHRVMLADGAHVEAGDAILEVVDASTLWFEGRVPEADAGAVAAGAMARVRVVGLPGEPLPVRIEALRPEADEATRMLWVHARVPNADGRLAAGRTAVASVQVGAAPAEEVLVPARAVVRDGLERVVFLRDSAATDKVVRTPVALGRGNRDWVEVLSGVMEGDEVVLDGVHELREAGGGKAPTGGHFHADGTWHADH